MISFVFPAHSREFFVDVGSPMQMTLPQPLTLGKVTDAARELQANPVTPMPVAKRPPPPATAPTSTGTCYTPDRPGARTIIPGTPPIGDMPDTPDIVVPGTPSIPGSRYPCP